MVFLGFLAAVNFALGGSEHNSATIIFHTDTFSGKTDKY